MGNNITVFESVTATDKPHLISIDKVLGYIKEGRYKEIVEKIRNSQNGVVESLKKTLPCVCFSGEFTIPVANQEGVTSYRTDKSLSSHSGFVPIDIDDIENLDERFEELKKNKYVYGLWKSPSGKGLHGLVRIADGSRHRHHYNALIKEIEGLDTTCRNESRILFISYDPDIYINYSASTFFDVVEDEKPKTKSELSYGDGFTDYRKIDVACRMVRLAPDGEKHRTLLKAAILLGGYVATNRVREEIAVSCLFNEICQRDIDDESTALKTIHDGVSHGMMKPIDDTEIEFNKALEEVGEIEEELNFLSPKGDDDNYIDRFRSGLIPMGLPFGYEDLDNHLLLKAGEFYGILGSSTIGKTRITLWLAFLSAIKHNWNWMIYTGENQSASSKMVIMEFLIGKKIHDMNDREFHRAKEWVNDMMYFVDTNKLYNYKSLITNAENLQKYKSLKGVFIDPYNSLISDLSQIKNKYIYDYEAYSEMLTFTKRTNVSLFLSAHTNTEAQRIRDRDGNPMMPNFSQAEGGSAFLNRIDNGICANRKIKDRNEWMITDLSIDKVRNKDTGGKPTANGDPVRLKMEHGVQFVDMWGRLPFDRGDIFRQLGI